GRLLRRARGPRPQRAGARHPEAAYRESEVDRATAPVTTTRSIIPRMRKRRFGPTGSDVPVIGIGTWNMERDDKPSAIAAIRRALELGLTHVDTAEMYGNGQVESLVGEAIAGLRDSVYLVSKVLPNHAS